MFLCRNEAKSIKLKGKKKDQSGDADKRFKERMYIAYKIMLMGMVEQWREEKNGERNCRSKRRKENHR
jgi:hypothetical protein